MPAIEVKSVVGNGVSYPVGKFGNGISFTGSSSGAFVEGFDIAVSQARTWCFWIKTTSIDGFDGVLQLGTSSYIGLASGKIRMAYVGQTALTGTTNINDGNWHYIEAGFHATTGSILFVDGNIELTSSVVYLPLFRGDGVTIGSFSGGSPLAGMMDDLALYDTQLHTSNYTPPTVEADILDPLLLWVARFEAAPSETTDGSVHILPNNANILYSPYTWNVGALSAITINTGAYFKVNFTGNSVTIKFDIQYTLAYYPQIYVRVDGLNGSWQQYSLTSDSVVVTMPSQTIGQGYHLLEVYVKSISTYNYKWSALSSSIRFKGLILQNGSQTVSKPVEETLKMICYGDSILEGANGVNSTAADYNDRNDGMASWAATLGELGCEVGIVGFSAVGIQKGGGAGVPPVISSYNLLYNGVSRSFASPPDVIVINLATNDISSVTVNFTAFLNNLLALNLSATIFVLRPFNGARAAELIAGIAACSDPGRVVYIDTTGYVPTGGYTDGLHPATWANISKISPTLRQIIRPYLNRKKRGFTKMY